MSSSVKIRDMTSNIRLPQGSSNDFYNKKFSVEEKKSRNEPQLNEVKNHNYTNLFKRFDSKVNPNKSPKNETRRN